MLFFGGCRLCLVLLLPAAVPEALFHESCMHGLCRHLLVRSSAVHVAAAAAAAATAAAVHCKRADEQKPSNLELFTHCSHVTLVLHPSPHMLMLLLLLLPLLLPPLPLCTARRLMTRSRPSLSSSHP
jgi:hypothetical protein